MSTKRRGAKPAKRRLHAPKPATRAPANKQSAAEKAFVESLVASGEAARRDASGRLPAGATHEIVETESGQVKVVRRRFAAF